MNISMQLVQDATVEPVSLERAKQHLRVDSDDEDDLIVFYITAARNYVERKLNRALIAQQWKLTMDNFPFTEYCAHAVRYGSGYNTAPAILLPRPSLISVDSITYVDEILGTQTLAPTSYIVIPGEPVRIYPASDTCWPCSLSFLPSYVQVTYTAGCGTTADAVPSAIVLAILMLVAHYYENRESTSQGMTISSVPMGVDALLSGYVFNTFAFER